MVVVLWIVGVAVAGVLVVWLAHLMLVKGGGGASASIGDGLGNFMDVFDPAAARSRDEQREMRHRAVVAPSPDDDDRPGRLLAGPDGTPKSIRIKRPQA